MYKQSIGGNYQNITHSAGVVFNMPQQKKETTPVREHSAPAPRIAAKSPVRRPKMSDDADGDGIVDSEDSCPNMMGLIQYGGCPQKIADPAEGSGVATQAMHEAPDYQEESFDFSLSGENEFAATERAEVKAPLEIDQADLDYLSFAVQEYLF